MRDVIRGAGRRLAGAALRQRTPRSRWRHWGDPGLDSGWSPLAAHLALQLLCLAVWTYAVINAALMVKLLAVTLGGWAALLTVRDVLIVMAKARRRPFRGLSA
ncbi:hypothetical protein GCM10009530_07300 [Microbispora corallina]|uniref:Uncharacterized protein n=1 Tax=Microbispora corallina TaxID=83302 RepID=A0ABQ4FV55_9ACTN|nr:hypothetical protein [Microbispora corallina]GIH38693.1 hypothetical protein Mco01_16930 [Microbispora corallina]